MLSLSLFMSTKTNKTKHHILKDSWIEKEEMQDSLPYKKERGSVSHADRY